MYRIGIIVNENEVAHSKYADTLETLKLAIDECNENGKKGNTYYFNVFDKFNVQELFDAGEKNIKTFDGIIIATNAMDNVKIHDAFCNNKEIVEEFINDNKGIFISSQKKLSNGSLSNTEYKSTGFLPEIYDYYLFDRPEKYSADGVISISSSNRILDYPYNITNGLIKNHCENNDFIVHRYRSLIIPKHPSAYETLLHDKNTPISQKELGYLKGDRKLLLSSHYNKRIVISTMALDWANHAELLSNILIYITEDKTPGIFVKRRDEQDNKNTIIDSYIIRANIAKLPFRVILENEIDNYINHSGSTFIFSPSWSSKAIEGVYAKMLKKQDKYFSVYHISKANEKSGNELKLVKYCNFSSIDTMKDQVIRKIIADYLSNSWHKSVWTYSYNINLIKFFDIDISIIAKKIYQELSVHFTKKEEASGEELVGNYDNVFNATCQMAEILHYFQSKYSDTISDDSQYNLVDVLTHAEAWIISKIETGSVNEQDVFYSTLYFLKHNDYNRLNNKVREKLTKLLEGIIKETLSEKIASTSSIDLCRIYQTICMLSSQNVFMIEITTSWLKRIENLLTERQDIYGNWKNISETAEITAMLLEAYEKLSEIDNTISILITKAIEFLHSRYNSMTMMWSDDLNTTAKAMYAISNYDRIFNFAINDFFLDLNHHQTNITKMAGADFTMIDRFYKNIDFLEKENESLNKAIQNRENDILKVKRKLSNNKTFSLLLFSLFISSLFMTVLIFIVLKISYENILSEILRDWKSWIIGAFIALIITGVWTYIYRTFNKKISE